VKTDRQSFNTTWVRWHQKGLTTVDFN